MKISIEKWERFNKNVTFDHFEGTFCSFYNESAEKNLHIHHMPDGSVRLLDDDLHYVYDDLDTDEELEAIHELMAIS